MPEGIRPRVNAAREFYEIAKDFKDPKEIIREALSNSWDANAKHASIHFTLMPMRGTRRKKMVVTIKDNGNGMSSEKSAESDTSEISDFFSLGDSNKPSTSIGTKGHGTKIYYKSNGITVDTWKGGIHLRAKTEVEPWPSLKNRIVPTYRYDEDKEEGEGTIIVVDGFEAKQKEFASTEQLISYVLWYTVAGSFSHYFGDNRRMDIELKTINLPTPVTVPFGFRFPAENLDLDDGSESFCKIFGPETRHCGTTEDGVDVEVNLMGALLGEGHRGIVPDTYNMMGAWLCKDFIRIERDNKLIENVFGGQYYFRSILLLANCQQFDLTANRNNVRSDDDAFDLAIAEIQKFIGEIQKHEDTENYFRFKKIEDAQNEEARKKEKENRNKARYTERLKERLNAYKGRPDLKPYSIKSAPRKEPQSEAEVALLLQAMISSEHPGIDFTIGEYVTSWGVDLTVEYENKGIPTHAWAELVITLEKLFSWSHPTEGIHKVICWELGKVPEQIETQNGRKGVLTKKSPGRYHLGRRLISSQPDTN